MEETFKKDVLRELRQGDGRILLHDEVEERPGVFSLVPIWEEVSEDDIMTPRNVYELMTKEGYHVSEVVSCQGITFMIITGRLCSSCCCKPSCVCLNYVRNNLRFCRRTNKHLFQMPFNNYCNAYSLAWIPAPETSSSIARWDVDVRRDPRVYGSILWLMTRA